MIGQLLKGHPVVIKRATKLEVLQAARALEERGWECIVPITQGFHDAKGYNAGQRSKRSYENGKKIFYYTKMKVSQWKHGNDS